MWWLTLLLACPASPGKVQSDLDKLCEIATTAENSLGRTSKQRAREVAKEFQKVDPAKATLAIMDKVAKTAPEKRYEVLVSEAHAAGHPDFDCPALERMVNLPPDPPKDGPAPAEPPKDPWW